MRMLIMLEQIEEGFAVQVPDLAIILQAATLEEARRAAQDAIRVNLEAYEKEGQPVPDPAPVRQHLDNADFKDHFFAFVEVPEPGTCRAA